MAQVDLILKYEKGKQIVCFAAIIIGTIGFLLDFITFYNVYTTFQFVMQSVEVVITVVALVWIIIDRNKYKLPFIISFYTIVGSLFIDMISKVTPGGVDVQTSMMLRALLFILAYMALSGFIIGPRYLIVPSLLVLILIIDYAFIRKNQFIIDNAAILILSTVGFAIVMHFFIQMTLNLVKNLETANLEINSQKEEIIIHRNEIIEQNRIMSIQKEAELNKYMLMALTKQMNPHFIFNSLNSIHCYILQNNQLESSKYLSKFSKLMRLVLEHSVKQTISLEDELEALSMYLELEVLRFKDKFIFEINCSPLICLKSTYVPSLFLQPFIENSIIHGLMHKEKLGNIIIDFKKNEKFLICTIEDNGIGRERSNEINLKKNSNHKSYGTSITEKRIQLINHVYGTEINVKYYDLIDVDGNAIGTKVEIYIATN